MRRSPLIPPKRYRKAAYIGRDLQVYSTESPALMLKCSEWFAPSEEKTRKALLRLRERKNWSRTTLAGILGVTVSTIRAWETGARTPCRAARKLVWMVESLFLEPKRLQSVADLVFWGRVGRDDPRPPEIKAKAAQPVMVLPTATDRRGYASQMAAKRREMDGEGLQSQPGPQG